MGKNKEVEEILINWCAEALDNKAFSKDYSINEDANSVFITITTEPITHLYKTYKVVCDLDEYQVKDAIELLERKKDELL